MVQLVDWETLLKLVGLDTGVDLTDDVVVDGVEKGYDDVLATHLQLLLSIFSLRELAQYMSKLEHVIVLTCSTSSCVICVCVCVCVCECE